MKKQTPLIRENPLTGGWSVITKYRKRKGHIEAIEKFDVTDQIEQIAEIIANRKANDALHSQYGDEVEE